MYNRMVIVICLMLLGVGGHTQEKEMIFFNTFKKAINEKSWKELEPLLSQDFKMGIYHDETAKSIIKNVLEHNEVAPDSVALKNNGKQRLEVEFYKEGKDPFSSFLHLDQNTQLVSADYFDSFYGINRNAAIQEVIQIPFEMRNGGIALKLKINDSEEEYLMLFDTGADGIALTEEVAKKVKAKNIRDHSASVVGGVQKTKLSSGNTIRYKDFALPNQNLAIFPQIRGGFDGIIGASLYRNYITEINFDENLMILYNFGKTEVKDPKNILPIDIDSGIPRIELGMDMPNGKEVHGSFVFDTGAGYNLIAFGPFVGKNNLTDDFKVEYASNTYSFGHATRTLTGYIPTIKLADHTFSNPIVTLQEYQEDNGEWTDNAGSLGIDIIKRFNFTINLLEREIEMVPNHAYNFPSDFIIGGMILNFDNEGNLVIKTVIQGSEADKKGLKQGGQINRIGGFSEEDLLKSEAVNKLISGDPNEDIVVFVTQGNQSLRVVL